MGLPLCLTPSAAAAGIAVISCIGALVLLLAIPAGQLKECKPPNL
ncbi:hypothetical protein [Pseudomonas sp. R37(2017)]|nr:hypothetical protein [Pseudomonas sp. R37(2017)]